MPDILFDAAAAVCLVIGCLMSVAAAIGLVRFPDLLTRMHAGTKPQVFGLLMLLTAVALENRIVAMLPLIALGWLFQLLTVPVSAHMVGRSTYRTKHLDRGTLTRDDLREVIDQVAGEQGGSTAKDSASADGQQTDGSAGTR